MIGSLWKWFLLALAQLMWAFLIKACLLSVVIIFIVGVGAIVNFSHIHLLLNCWTNFNQSWHKVILAWGNLYLFNWKAMPFQGEIIGKYYSENIYYSDNFSKSYDENHVCSNEGDCSFKGEQWMYSEFSVSDYLIAVLKLICSLIIAGNCSSGEQCSPLASCYYKW